MDKDKVIAAFQYKYSVLIITERGDVYKMEISDLTSQVSIQKIANELIKS